MSIQNNQPVTISRIHFEQMTTQASNGKSAAAKPPPGERVQGLNTQRTMFPKTPAQEQARHHLQFSLHGLIGNMVRKVAELVLNVLRQVFSSLEQQLPKPQPGNSSPDSGSGNVTTPVQQPNTPESSTPLADTPTQSGYAEGLARKLRSTLTPNAEGKVHEEQLQHGIVAHLLEQVDPKAASAYAKAFSHLAAGDVATEDAVKRALKKVVKKGLVSKEKAEEINGISFRAAQLDKNHKALYDGRGGPDDPTIAVASLKRAIKKATAVLEKVDAGELKVAPRSLDAPSNGIPGRRAHASGISGRGTVTANRQGFLWKPVSESDGKLVVLLPPGLTGQVASAGIYSSLPPSGETLIEKGRFSGDSANGGRAHFRFSKPGGAYADGVYVVAHLKDGSIVKFRVGESSQRTT